MGSDACALCLSDSADKKYYQCVSCRKWVCKACCGDEGKSYWSHDDRKGRACRQCIEDDLAFEGGTFYVGNKAIARLNAKLYPKVMQDVDKKLYMIRSDIVPPLIDDAVQKLETAFARQREELVSSTKAMQETLIKALYRHLFLLVGSLFGVVILCVAAVYFVVNKTF